MNLYQRINKVRESISYIQKDKSVSAGPGGSYRAVTHDAVTGLLREHLVRNGVIVAPTLISGVLHDKKEGEKQRMYVATYEIRFINMDSPEESLSIMIEAHALDNGDKAPGKAISYATKYALLKLFAIETGEDEESRYQVEAFDVTPYLDEMRECKTLDSLGDAFKKSFKVVGSTGDKEAMKTLIAVKDACKSDLTPKEAAA